MAALERAVAPAEASDACPPPAPPTPLRDGGAEEGALEDVSLSDGGDTPREGTHATLKGVQSAPVLRSAADGAPDEAGGGGVAGSGPAIHALLRHGASGSGLDALAPPQDPAKFGEKAGAAAPAGDAAAAAAAERDARGGADGGSGGVAAPAPPPLSNERVALFDLDLTLLDVNTGRLWVEKEFREGKVPFQIYLLAVYWFAKYAAGLGVDAGEVTREAMSLYSGQSSGAMAQEVEQFWAAECEARVRPGARAALAAHRAKGERCVLCTATWQHVAAMARRALALDGAVCSVLHVGDDGCFTGGVSDAYGDAKWARTAEWAAREGIDLRNCTFYTDSYSDARLLEAVGTPVAVCPDSRLADHARKRGWRIEDWGEAPPCEAKQRYSCAVFGMKCM